ncbi:nucleotidyltransferase domain-containing protein [Kluyvera sp. STS39-E]|uniref:nucleotidyltransferase domain-containing protein n=1 Tax=Kluyvera sp. STS39-E TaxID=3234748 RepID=UPI0034C630FD
MYPHHKDAIDKAIQKLSKDKKILAVILGGSVAHGFAAESSDIDLMLVLSEVDYQQALHQGNLHYADKESANYPGGYVEGKYISESFIKAVAEKGSEPARFAFKDAILLYSALDNINDLISAAAAYPLEGKADKIEKFNAQFEGWNWMYHEGLKRNDLYAINYAVTHLCLFSGRLLLAHNELLYPYHKWFLRVLESAPARPKDIIKTIHSALTTKSECDISHLYHSVKNFHDWPQYQHGWVAKFVIDSEINWLNGPVPITDL